eukprot:TRINITY_DN31345_c0_g2_i1.p1 TRINITY_DN31345_c0_g2~~TRINITY_DN31345_c0_g2_i1.p1  ORF type:complete len:389 (+),score=76.67 TRINITY_DN31345_c0_g2_i1:132-1169(+)
MLARGYTSSGLSSSGEAQEDRESACLPCCNCCIAVPQDRYVAVERFGKFSHLLSSGLQVAGLDVCGLCITFRSISSRVDQHIVQVTTKTKDNVFVTATVAVQHLVKSTAVELALYQLSDVQGQIESYVADVVRSHMPRLDLDEAFEKKDEISDAVQTKLASELEAFGLVIRKALVTEVSPALEVVDAMNEINRQKRLRDAAVMAAEAEKVRVVKAAEAEADAAQLQGEGIARQRRAIIDGLRDSISHATGSALNSQEVTELLLITQYFETLRDVAGSNKSSTVFMDGSPGAVADASGQLRQGLLHKMTNEDLQSRPLQEKMMISAAPSLGSQEALVDEELRRLEQ